MFKRIKKTTITWQNSEAEFLVVHLYKVRRLQIEIVAIAVYNV